MLVLNFEEHSRRVSQKCFHILDITSIINALGCNSLFIRTRQSVCAVDNRPCEAGAVTMVQSEEVRVGPGSSTATMLFMFPILVTIRLPKPWLWASKRSHITKSLMDEATPMSCSFFATPLAGTSGRDMVDVLYSVTL